MILSEQALFMIIFFFLLRVLQIAWHLSRILLFCYCIFICQQNVLRCGCCVSNFPGNVGLSDVVVSKYEVFHTYLNYVFMTCGYQRQCPKLMTSYLHLSFITSLQMSQPDVNMWSLIKLGQVLVQGDLLVFHRFGVNHFTYFLLKKMISFTVLHTCFYSRTCHINTAGPNN